MKKLVKIMICAVLVGSVLWTATPSIQRNADVTGPGPMSIGNPVADYTGPDPMSIENPVADFMGPGPISVKAEEHMVAVFETPSPDGIVSYKG